MGLAVVGVRASGVELGGVLLSGSVQVVIVGEGLGVDTGGDGIFVKDNVVGEASVVYPGNGIALGNGDGGGVEDEGTCGESVYTQSEIWCGM